MERANEEANTLFDTVDVLFGTADSGEFEPPRLLNACLLAFEAFLPSSRGTGRWFFFTVTELPLLSCTVSPDSFFSTSCSARQPLLDYCSPRTV